MPRAAAFRCRRAARMRSLRHRTPAHRMAPARRQFAQRQEHKGATFHPRMRKARRPLLHPAVIIEEVEVERAGRVGRAAAAPETGLHLMEHCKQRGGLKIGPHRRNRINESRVLRIRPSRASVETGLLLNRYASSRQAHKAPLRAYPRACRQGKEDWLPALSGSRVRFPTINIRPH